MSESRSMQGKFVFINRFKVTNDDIPFEQLFSRSAEFLADQPGYEWNVLLKCPDDEEYDFVNVACWENHDRLVAATQHPDFRTHAESLRRASVSRPLLPTVVSSDGAA